MAQHRLVEEAEYLADQTARIALEAQDLAIATADYISSQGGHAGPDPFITALTVFVLGCFVGYYVVWKVTPALHSPLMAVTNAISSVIIVGALMAAGITDASLAKMFGFLAVMLASVNIFGGFIVTSRMLSMFKKSD